MLLALSHFWFTGSCCTSLLFILSTTDISPLLTRVKVSEIWISKQDKWKNMCFYLIHNELPPCLCYSPLVSSWIFVHAALSFWSIPSAPFRVDLVASPVGFCFTSPIRWLLLKCLRCNSSYWLPRMCIWISKFLFSVQTSTPRFFFFCNHQILPQSLTELRIQKWRLCGADVNDYYWVETIVEDPTTLNWATWAAQIPLLWKIWLPNCLYSGNLSCPTAFTGQLGLPNCLYWATWAAKLPLLG